MGRRRRGRLTLAIDAWNTFFQRGALLHPILLGAPMIFDPAGGVGLGELQMLIYVFIDVLYAVNAFALNWPQINELRATAFRLREFEREARIS